MAKQCIYCGRPLAKDDARFCNDCGRSQVVPVSAGSGAAAPAAIKVKLPPKEYMRDDLSSTQQETSLPGPAASATPVPLSPREQAPSPSSRLPKRPTRLAPQTPPLAVDKAKPAGEPVSAVVRQADAEPVSAPTPAEEASTMVLPNWREELAQLRKEQEQARADASVTTEKKPEREAKEPPPLPRRSPGAPLASTKVDSSISPTSQPRSPYGTRSAVPPQRSPDTPQPQNNARLAEAPSTPVPPRENVRPADPPSRAPSTPLAPKENARPADASRRELRVKVWEQETLARSAPSQEEKQEPGPASAVEQNPLASVDFGAEEQILEGEELESVTWQTPLTPLPASRNQPPVREEKRSLAEEEIQAGEEEERSVAREQKRPPLQEGVPKPTHEEKRQRTAKSDKQDIEDLPTVPLAVPEIAKPEPAIKVERASTPAPKKWSTPRTDNVEDLPTRPMAASPGGAVTSRSSQQPAPSGGPRSEVGQADLASPSAQRSSQPSPSSGAFDSPLAAQPTSRVTETDVDALASRARPANPHSQPGPIFDPASLPPLPPGPLPAPVSSRARPELQGPAGPPPRLPASSSDVPGQHPPQRPPSFEPASASVSTPVHASKSKETGADRTKQPRKKRHTGRLIVVILLVLVLGGVGVGAALNWEWVMQYFRAPAQSQPYQTYQNSTLGVSLEYTQHWSVNADQAHSAVHFSDSSHTSQVNLTVATASGQAGDYLNQQATQLGITGSKVASPATMGGSSWQALQGIVTQSGATYVAALYATQHNGHFYLLEFLAPQSNFKYIDQSNFAHMRSSFKFL